MAISAERKQARLWRAFQRVEARLAHTRRQRDIAYEDLADEQRLRRKAERALREAHEELDDVDAHTIAMLEYCSSRFHLLGRSDIGNKVDDWITEITHAQAIRHRQAAGRAPLPAVQLAESEASS